MAITHVIANTETCNINYKWSFMYYNLKKYISILILLMLEINSYSQVFYVDTRLYPFLFDTGSTWIYEKNNQKIFDSVLLTKTKHGFDWDVKTYYEYYKFHFTSCKNTDTFDFEFKMQTISLQLNNYETQIYKKDKLINHFDSLKIQNTTFYDVDVMKTDSNILYYWSKNVGVIRIDSTLHNNNITLEWNLVKSKTNKYSDIHIANKQNTQLSVYPNPAQNKIRFESGIIMLKLCIYNMNGKLISEVSSINKNEYDLDLENIPPGLYLFQIYNTKGMSSGKFTKH